MRCINLNKIFLVNLLNEIFNMEVITQKEAFECAVAQVISISQTLNKKGEKIYDYSLCLQEGSLDPITCLQPGKFFEWKNLERNQYGQKSYAFVPIGYPYSSLVVEFCGLYGDETKFEKFNVMEHPCPWIKETLLMKYIKASFFTGYFTNAELVHNMGLFSKCHSTWVRGYRKDDGTTMYLPYYAPNERKKLLESIPIRGLEEIYDAHGSRIGNRIY